MALTRLAGLRRWALAPLFLALWGCAGISPDVPPDHQTLQLDVPFVEQQLAYCGPAALTSTLQYYGRDVPLETLVSQVYVPGREGSLTLEMTASVRRQGLLPYQIPGSLDALLAELDAGHPVLILQNLGFSWWPQWHYALVVGYRDAGEKLLLHSGSRPYYEISSGTLMRTWARGEHWGLVAVPLDNIPASADALQYLATLDSLRQLNTVDTGAQGVALSKAANHWPESAAVQFVYANWLLETGKAESAVEAFRRGLALQRDNALAWNNYAFALAAQGCGEQARVAIARAVKLAPQDKRLEESARELQSAPGSCG